MNDSDLNEIRSAYMQYLTTLKPEDWEALVRRMLPGVYLLRNGARYTKGPVTYPQTVISL